MEYLEGGKIISKTQTVFIWNTNEKVQLLRGLKYQLFFVYFSENIEIAKQYSANRLQLSYGQYVGLLGESSRLLKKVKEYENIFTLSVVFWQKIREFFNMSLNFQVNIVTFYQVKANICFVSVSVTSVPLLLCHCSYLTNVTTTACPTQISAIMLITATVLLQLRTQLVTSLLELQLTVVSSVLHFYSKQDQSNERSWNGRFLFSPSQLLYSDRLCKCISTCILPHAYCCFCD